MSAATAAVEKMPGKSSSISVKILLRWNHTATIIFVVEAVVVLYPWPELSGTGE
jgi:hypothetical protein